MLVRVTRTARRCAATIVGVLYAFCVIVPSAAVAFGGDAAHCFTADQLGLTHVHQPAAGHSHVEALGNQHVHADGTTHHHDGSHHPGTNDRNDSPAACCGLFGVTAMAVDPHLELGAPSQASSILPVSLEKLTGRGPDRINRPPIALLPL